MRCLPLSDADELLRILDLRGVSGKRKVRQLECLLPWLLDEAADFEGRPLMEFACGKGYVSFAFRHMTRQLDIDDIPVIGLDSSESVIARCQAIRDQLGWGNMDFRLVKRGDAAEGLPSPHAVVSLHACDTATDQAIAAGIALGARLLLHVPCCHSTVQRTLRVDGHRHSLGRICRCYPVLGESFSRLLTEGMRCMQMRAFGYQVIMREFVSPLITPKNLLIVGRLNGRQNRRAAEEAALFSREYGIPLYVMRMVTAAGGR